MEEKILTRDEVIKLGLDEVQVITADMLKGYTIIGTYAFNYCFNLISVTIPNSVTSIEVMAFHMCSNLTSVTIPDSVTNIGSMVFTWCTHLTSMVIPNSVVRIGIGAFACCSGLTSVIIGNTEYKKHEIINGKCKAYKAFSANMTCRGFQYEEGKTYELDGEPKLCKCGFHAALSLSDVFNYYYGEFGKNVIIHEVELEGVIDERKEFDSKVVAKKITIGKRIL